MQLLNLHVHRDAPDPDYTGFGHCRADVTLESADGSRQHVRDALVLALHCTEGTALPDDVELEFFVPEGGPDYSVTVLLSTFLATWLPRVCRDARAVVLALCNPGRAVIRRPAGLGRVPLFYAAGDVETWFDDGIRLVADSWTSA